MAVRAGGKSAGTPERAKVASARESSVGVTVHNGPIKTQEQNGPFARALGHGPPSKFRRPQRHEQHKENPAQLVSSRQAAESVDTPPPRGPSCEFELKFSNLSLRPASASPLETPAPQVQTQRSRPPTVDVAATRHPRTAAGDLVNVDLVLLPHPTPFPQPERGDDAVTKKLPHGAMGRLHGAPLLAPASSNELCGSEVLLPSSPSV